MDLLDKGKLLFTDASKFFNKFKKEDWIVAYKYAVIIGLLSGVLGQLRAVQAMDNAVLGALSATIGLFMAVLIGPFVNSILPHIGVMLFGKKDYWKTFKAITYGRLVGAIYAIPALIIMLFAVGPDGKVSNMLLMVPFGLLILAAVVHSLYTQVVGLKTYHHLSYVKGMVCALIIPLGIALFIVALLVSIFVIGGVLDPAALA